MDDHRLDRIEDKIDKLSEHLGKIDSTLSAQHVSLEHHIKRTDLLEGQVAPIKKHVEGVQWGIKIVGWTGGIASTAVAVLKFIKMI